MYGVVRLLYGVALLDIVTVVVFQAWHGLLVSKIQELQEICCRNIGDTGKKITGNIGEFYENIEFHQFQKYRRNWPLLQELQEI